MSSIGFSPIRKPHPVKVNDFLFHSSQRVSLSLFHHDVLFLCSLLLAVLVSHYIFSLLDSSNNQPVFVDRKSPELKQLKISLHYRSLEQRLVDLNLLTRMVDSYSEPRVAFKKHVLLYAWREYCSNRATHLEQHLSHARDVIELERVKDDALHELVVILKRQQKPADSLLTKTVKTIRAWFKSNGN
jgi:hypothetical protein